MITIYGIKNCDTVRKALKWAEANGLEHNFHDFRKDPVSEEVVAGWLSSVGSDILVNKRGTTYRKLEDEQKAELEGENICRLLAEQPTLMKRPIFDLEGQYVVGFTDAQKTAVLEVLKK